MIRLRLTAHHTPTFSLSTGTSCMELGYSCPILFQLMHLFWNEIHYCTVCVLNSFFSQLTSEERQLGYFQQESATAHMANATMVAIQEVFQDLIIYICDVMRGMFASRRGALWTPVIKHGKFMLSFYSILIHVCLYRNWCEGIRKWLHSC
jgi:hypothetical protein